MDAPDTETPKNVSAIELAHDCTRKHTYCVHASLLQQRRCANAMIHVLHLVLAGQHAYNSCAVSGVIEASPICQPLPLPRNASQVPAPQTPPLSVHTTAMDVSLNRYLPLSLCYVSEISLWKRNHVPNHEIVVVRFICRGKDVGALGMETSLTSSSFPTAANNFLTLYKSTDIAAATRDSSLVITCAIPEEKHITTAAVIAACSVILQKVPEYQLRTKQCFWFAGLALRLIAGDDTVAKMQSADNNSKHAGEVASFWTVMGEPLLTDQAKKMHPDYNVKLKKVEFKVTLNLEATVIREAKVKIQEAEAQIQEAVARIQEAEVKIQEMAAGGLA
ncbi:hypothetical protein C8Q72DRAFT_934826 [Fomitopsis betulina]|nr:hypothetical protein C8Q72DRAFT_934826 [Fomitopsis betulina]